MIALLLSAVGVLAAAGPPRPSITIPDGGGPPAAPATPAAKETLRAALDDARSDAPARHEHLLAQLQNRRFLAGVDSPEDYAQAASDRLHVGQIVDALARNPAPSAQRTFLRLTTSKVFLAHDERVIALILASVNVRPAPPDLVRFWDRRSRPNDGFTPTTISALVDNASEPALRLLERKLVDPAHSDDEKLSWMRTDMLSHRNDLPLLEASARLLKGPLPKRLRPALVEVLFDYRPGEWFKPDHGASAPPLASASVAAQVELRKLGDLALRTVALSSTQKSAVMQRLQELDKLKGSTRGGPG